MEGTVFLLLLERLIKLRPAVVLLFSKLDYPDPTEYPVFVDILC